MKRYGFVLYDNENTVYNSVFDDYTENDFDIVVASIHDADGVVSHIQFIETDPQDVVQ